MKVVRRIRVSAAKPREPAVACAPGAMRPDFFIVCLSRGKEGLFERGQDYAAVRTSLSGRKVRIGIQDTGRPE